MGMDEFLKKKKMKVTAEEICIFNIPNSRNNIDVCQRAILSNPQQRSRLDGFKMNFHKKQIIQMLFELQHRQR